jgi:hypothetical protein
MSSIKWHSRNFHSSEMIWKIAQLDDEKKRKKREREKSKFKSNRLLTIDAHICHSISGIKSIRICLHFNFRVIFLAPPSRADSDGVIRNSKHVKIKYFSIISTFKHTCNHIHDITHDFRSIVIGTWHFLCEKEVGRIKSSWRRWK